MILHIDDKIVKTKDIIGVFNSKIFNNSDVEDENSSVIITDKNNYYSKISLSTIQKRLNNLY